MNKLQAGSKKVKRAIKYILYKNQIIYAIPPRFPADLSDYNLFSWMNPFAALPAGAVRMVVA
jgi:hypothetical protein